MATQHHQGAQQTSQCLDCQGDKFTRQDRRPLHPRRLGRSPERPLLPSFSPITPTWIDTMTDMDIDSPLPELSPSSSSHHHPPLRISTTNSPSLPLSHSHSQSTLAESGTRPPSSTFVNQSLPLRSALSAMELETNPPHTARTSDPGPSSGRLPFYTLATRAFRLLHSDGISFLTRCFLISRLYRSRPPGSQAQITRQAGPRQSPGSSPSVRRAREALHPRPRLDHRTFG